MDMDNDREYNLSTPVVVSVMRPGEMPKKAAICLLREARNFLEAIRKSPDTWVLLSDAEGNPVGGTHTPEAWLAAVEIRQSSQWN